MKRSLFGFTLAEVLITLAIIGIVAALTIPAIVRNYQKTQTVTQLKKAYNQMNQAINMSQIENSDVSNWEFGEALNGDDMQAFMDKYIYPYLKIAKNCGTSPGCFPSINYCLTKSICANMDTIPSMTKVVLADGTSMAAYMSSKDRICLYFDINGVKKPNTRGKDIFEFRIAKTPLGNVYFYPNSFENSRSSIISGGCSKTSSGNYCAALIMKDGWEIKDDYPW